MSEWYVLRDVDNRDGSAEADGARHIRYKKKGQTND